MARELLAALSTLELPAHRATPPEQLHMTVLFVGETPERELRAVTESVERAAAGVGAFGLIPQRLIALPDGGPARLVAALTDAPGELVELRRRLVSRLVVRRAKSAGFVPHLTLCRFRSPTRCSLPPRALDSSPFRVDALSLMSSVLRPEGAEHRQLARIALD